MTDINLAAYDDVTTNDRISDADMVARSLDVPPLVVNEKGVPIFKTIDEAVRVYVERRDALKSFMANANLIDETTKAELAQISMWLRDKGDELGIDSFKTQYGTAFRNVKTSYRMGDWNQFIEWVKATENYQCLEKRVAKLSTKEIHDDTGEVPPGINYSAEVEFDVRKPITRKG